MKCDSPVNIRDPVDPLSKRYIAVPCGRCATCLQRKRSDWTIRIKEELKNSIGSAFVTLTYQTKFLPVTENGEITLSKRDLQLFLKRLRKHISFKYYAVGEYGTERNRPHYHIIFLGIGHDLIHFQKLVEKSWSENGELIGRIDTGNGTGASVNYCAGYIINRYDFINSEIVAPFALASKSLGITYVDKMRDWHTADLNRQYVPGENGAKYPLPRYYKQKLFTDEQKREIKKLHEKRILEEIATYDPDQASVDCSFEMDRKEARRRRIEIRNKKSKF